MLVQTYECEETMTETQEMAEDAIRLIEQMGLSGQQSLCKKRDDEQHRRSPYRLMTSEEAVLFGLLCEGRASLKNYNAGPIPLRVLQVAAHVKTLELPEMAYMEVWYPAEVVRKDPVLVARGHEWHNREVNYILARWGDELDEGPALVKKATEIFRDKMRTALEGIITQCKVKLAGVDSLPIGKGSIPQYFD